MVVVRKGSIDGLAEEIGDPALLALALADYERSRRRERASRKDFVLGYVAAIRRLKFEPGSLSGILEKTALTRVA